MLSVVFAAAACSLSAHGQLPDRGCSPGAVRSRATAAQVCVAGYASRTRNVTQSTRDTVYARYGQTGAHPFPAWEVDHRVPLELGGSNSLRNLWPEHLPQPKDRLENRLHARVCSGSMTLGAAQRVFLGDWRRAL